MVGTGVLPLVNAHFADGEFADGGFADGDFADGEFADKKRRIRRQKANILYLYNINPFWVNFR